MDEGQYHHGNLPAALMDAVDDLIREGGVGAVSLREVARRVGVSHAAPAHHFGNKAGLLTAFAAEGFRLLRDHLATAVAADGTADAASGFSRVGVAYVEFAVRHPSHFAVMFRPEHVDAQDAAYGEAAGEAFAVVFEGVRAIRDDLSTDDPQLLAAATGAWSLAHGFATLWLDGNMSQLVAREHAGEAAADAFLAFGATIITAVQRAAG